MKNIINTQLYDFLKKILIEAFWEKKDFNVLKNKLDRLKQASFKKTLLKLIKNMVSMMILSLMNNHIFFASKT